MSVDNLGSVDQFDVKSHLRFLTKKVLCAALHTEDPELLQDPFYVIFVVGKNHSDHRNPIALFLGSKTHAFGMSCNLDGRSDMILCSAHQFKVPLKGFWSVQYLSR